MTTLVEQIGLSTPPLQIQRAVQDDRLGFAHTRLTEALETAKAVPFDDSSRIVFFSDCHRGDNSQADIFTGNEALFLHALNHYYQDGFTYIEVGDGDELWQNRRFADIRRAHGRVFDLLHRFDQQDRLHIVFGNHDIRGNRHDPIEKDGIVAHEGLVLQHARTRQRIFVVHGHQADFVSDRLYVMSRFFVRIWKHLQCAGVRSGIMLANEIQTWLKIEHGTAAWLQTEVRKIERRIIQWLHANRQVVICGHTHRPMCGTYGVPYFNTGSCTRPGVITGLEIQDGEITLVRWSAESAAGQGGALRIKRACIAPPRELRAFD